MVVRGRGSINLGPLRINWVRHGLFGLPLHLESYVAFGAVVSEQPYTPASG